MARKRDVEMQLEQLQKQVEGLQKELTNYRAKEFAIVHALTDAQETRNKRIAEAEEEAARILSEAREKADSLVAESEQAKTSLEEETAARTKAIVSEAEENARLLQDDARLLKCDAEREAARVEAEAKMLAKNTMEESGQKAKEKALAAEKDLNDFQWQLKALRQLLCYATERARLQTTIFHNALNGIWNEADNLFAEGKGLRTLIDPHKADLPEEYATPSELMRGLYKLEGRELPEEAPSQTGLDMTGETEPAAQAETEPAAQMREDPPTVPAPLPFVPAEHKRQDEDEAPEENAETEERIWTVGEIVGARRREMDAAAEIMSDVDLDTLLDEIMDEE